MNTEILIGISFLGIISITMINRWLENAKNKHNRKVISGAFSKHIDNSSYDDVENRVRAHNIRPHRPDNYTHPVSSEETVLERYLQKETESMEDVFNRGMTTSVINGGGMSFNYDGHNEREIRRRQVRELTEAQERVRNSNYKEKLIFHGGCQSCNTPQNETIGTCFDCQYFGGWHLEDKSKLYPESSQGDTLRNMIEIVAENNNNAINISHNSEGGEINTPGTIFNWKDGTVSRVTTKEEETEDYTTIEPPLNTVYVSKKKKII